MNILIEVPTWLGDAVMTTPAIENILLAHPEAKLTLFGSFVSTQALQMHPLVERVVEDTSKKKGCRVVNLFFLARSLGSFDIAFSFRKTLTSAFFLKGVKAKEKYQYRRISKKIQHQTQHYNHFVQQVLKTHFSTNELTLFVEKKSFTHPTLGINPGATYGSAKRWDPLRFATVASVLSQQYDIIIFGGLSEVDTAADIETELQAKAVTNYLNLAGKTTIPELLAHIAGLDFFITNDSGPMHVAAAYQIPSVTIFGPTKHSETSQWMNPRSRIVRDTIDCAPCMKRVCPLKTDECMQNIHVDHVLSAVEAIQAEGKNTQE